MVRRIVVATHNRGKIREIEHILADEMGSAAARFEFITSEDAGLPERPSQSARRCAAHRASCNG